MNVSEIFAAHPPRAAWSRPEDAIPVLPDETGNAAKVWTIMQHLTLGTGKWAGTPFSERAMEWQRRGVYAVLGPAPANPEDRHWVSTWFIESSKKQAKSAFSALFTLAYVLAFPEPDGRYYLLASNKQSASLLYDPLQAAILNDPHLSKLCNVRAYKRDVIVYETGQEIKCLALDLESTVGMVAQFVAIDELHLITRNRRGQHMLGQLWSGLSVTGGLSVVTTTKPLPGESMAGVYASLRRRAVDLYEGRAGIEETLLPTIFEPLQDTDIATPEGLSDALWRANPSMGVTVTEVWLRQQYDIAASSMDVTDLDLYRSQHLNQFVESSAAGTDGWPPAREWSSWTDSTLTLDRLVEESDEIFAGIDAGGMDDLTGLVLLGRTADDRYLVWSHAWLTQHGFESWPKNQALYREAERIGELTITAAPGEDLDELLRLLAEVPNLNGVGVDPIGLEELVTRLQERGVEAVGIPQGYKLSPHLEAAERAYYAGKIRHADHPLLAWCVRNMRLRDRGGAKAVVKPSGESMGPDKIDLGICLVMAMATVSAAPPAWNVDAVIG